MTINETIELLREHLHNCGKDQLPGHTEAIKLSIEVLYRLKGDRVAGIVRKDLPLQGETE